MKLSKKETHKERTAYKSKISKQSLHVKELELAHKKDPANKEFEKQYWKAYYELCNMLENYEGLQ